MKKVIILAAVLFLAACADQTDTPDPTKPDCQPGVVTSDCPAQ